ncbi:hypothetical protein OOU_Y34scaffold00826g3 [Pyricularia oryzae Y34]|uniref:Uncharacterized protein n=1 Tax=Pyricularia oryzae (strain Y34) TaxID=1143189 RepID=A0AA97PGR1_PYRO3|nr:hypothetical protein OOU_Y34scaffold00826g3 [Pyricularia oryzae Y34]
MEKHSGERPRQDIRARLYQAIFEQARESVALPGPLTTTYKDARWCRNVIKNAWVSRRLGPPTIRDNTSEQAILRKWNRRWPSQIGRPFAHMLGEQRHDFNLRYLVDRRAGLKKFHLICHSRFTVRRRVSAFGGYSSAYILGQGFMNP